MDEADATPTRADAPTPRALRDALDLVLLESLRPVLLGLALIYLFFALADPLTIPGALGIRIGIIEGCVAAWFLGMAIVLARTRIPTSWAHPVGGSIALVVLLEVIHQMSILPDPLQTTYLMLLEIGVGIFFLSWPWLVAALLLTDIAWLWVAESALGTPVWNQFGFALLTATILAGMVHMARMRTFERLEATLYRERLQEAALAQALRGVQQSEDRFRSLSEAAFEGIAVHENGRILDANTAFAAIFGVQTRELVGRPAWEFLAPENHSTIIPLIMSGGPAGAEAMGVRFDGTRVPIELSCKVVPYGGRTAGVLAIRDISERKRIEEAGRVALERLTEIERLKEMDSFKTQLLNVASHELYTPLTALKLQIHLLNEATKAESPARQERALEVVNRNVDRLGRLVQDLLDVSRLQGGRAVVRKTATDLTDLLNEVLVSFEAVSQHEGVALEADIADGLWVDGDAGRLTQVLFNLLTNAFKFTPRGGSVRVDAAARDQRVLCSVTDTGTGINPDDIERLFKPFSQLGDPMQRTEAGTGLGLYISKGIIELHNGRIWCESAGTGKGTTFAFELPALASAAERLKAPPVQ